MALERGNILILQVISFIYGDDNSNAAGGDGDDGDAKVYKNKVEDLVLLFTMVMVITKHFYFCKVLILSLTSTWLQQSSCLGILFVQVT